MRLSDAMVLGSTLVKMHPGCWETCAIGAAASAVGIPVDDARVESIIDEWPWLQANNDRYFMEILTLFDQKVCQHRMSMEALIAYVRQIEPPCDCGVRDCVCARVEGLMPPAVEVFTEELEPAF